MRHPLTFLAVLFFALAAPCVSASREGILPLSEFSISSQGIGSSGPVKVSGTQTSSGISQLKVEAFGRAFVAPADTVKGLQGFFVNGMLLSYVHGYTETGGRTVYLSFFKGFTSGLTETKRVYLSESGEFKLLKGVGQ